MQYKLRKPLQRIYELVSLLLKADKPLSKQTVAQRINCSRPTLDTTIISANQLIEKFGEICFTDEGLVVKNELLLNERYLRSLVSNETFIVNFLYSLLFDDIHSVEEWSYRHFYSPSTSYKYIRKVSNYLKGFEISLLNNEGRWYLQGNVWQIRFIYFEILKEKAILDDSWPFPTINQSMIQRFVQSVSREFNLYLSPLIEYQYTLMVGIHIAMKDNPNTIEEVDEDKMNFVKDNHDFDEIIFQLEQDLDCHLSDLDITLIVSSIELFPVEYLDEETEQRRILYSKLTDPIAFPMAECAYKIFTAGYEASFVHYLDIFTPIEVVPHFHDFSFEHIDELVDDDFYVKVDAKFGNFLALFEKEMDANKYRESYQNNRIYIIKRLYMLYLQQRTKETHAPLKITILSQYGPLQEQYYESKISQYFPSGQLLFFPGKLISQENRWQDIDLVVVDYIFQNDDNFYNLFYIDEYLGKKTIQRLNKIVQQHIFLQKNKGTS